MTKIILLNKPYNVLSQFTSSDGHPGLAGFVTQKNYYPAGRLDRDSEGLLLLTNDGQLQARITEPGFKMEKTYLVQVEGEISTEALSALSHGITLNDGKTLPAKAKRIAPPDLWPRDPPVRHRQDIPTSWINLSLTEGRNRQVRRMTAATGFPTLRLIRQKIGPWELMDLQPGESRMEEVNLPSEKFKPHQARKKLNRNKEKHRAR